jgi:hypothetical protein
MRTVRNDAALKALQHAERILEILVEIAEHGESDAHASAPPKRSSIFH